MKTTQPLDVVFVLDCTESMTPWIVAARNQVQTTMEYLRSKFPNVTMRVALVAYRDFGDQVERSIVDFTEDFDRIRGRLNTLEAEGGADQAEDLAGALYDVNHLNWAGTEWGMCFVITDAPTHGCAFHPPHVSDRWQDDTEIPSGISFTEQVDILAGNGIDMTFVRITPDTDMMITVMGCIYDEHYTPFHVIDLKKMDQASMDAGFSALVVKQVSARITGRH